MRSALCLALLLACCSRKPAPDAAPSAAASSSADAREAALLAVGSEVPDVGGSTQSGERLRLRELAGKPVVVYFYPKDDSPGCTIEAEELRDLYRDIQSTGAVVVGVSTDDGDSHRAFTQKYALPFALLSDPDGGIARAFGVSRMPGGRLHRTTFVIGRDGRVKKVFREVTPKGHGAEVLAALRAL
jgi:thioredoxin-dependent peroxiredoxin